MKKFEGAKIQGSIEPVEEDTSAQPPAARLTTMSEFEKHEQIAKEHSTIRKLMDKLGMGTRIEPKKEIERHPMDYVYEIVDKSNLDAHQKERLIDILEDIFTLTEQYDFEDLYFEELEAFEIHDADIDQIIALINSSPLDSNHKAELTTEFRSTVDEILTKKQDNKKTS